MKQLVLAQVKKISDFSENPVERSDTKWGVQGDSEVMLTRLYHTRQPDMTFGLTYLLVSQLL